jgi:hypothetical protein
MSNLILLPLVLFVGVAIGFVVCSLLRANGSDLPDHEVEDTKRLDFLHHNKLHLGVRLLEDGAAWGVVGADNKMVGTVSDSARGAIDIARAAMNAQ